jgi:hypothetical protein
MKLIDLLKPSFLIGAWLSVNLMENLKFCVRCSPYEDSRELLRLLLVDASLIEGTELLLSYSTVLEKSWLPLNFLELKGVNVFVNPSLSEKTLLSPTTFST